MQEHQHRTARLGEKAAAAGERAEALDSPGYKLGNAMALPLRVAGGKGQRVRNALHGNWYGHPLHPTLVPVPIGAWTVAAAFDVLDTLDGKSGDRYRDAADLNIAAGCVGAVAAAAAGMADWNHTHGKDRRVGLAHAALNTTSLALYGSSLALRRRGRRREGKLVGALAWSLLFGGAYLGAHLVYRRRIGVDQADRSSEPRDFTAVVALRELEEDRPRRVEIWDEHARAMVGVALVLHRGRVHALGARCSHMGGPLGEGWVLGGGLVCPWHGSRYDLATGHPIDGPSTCPQPRYETRVRDGVVEIRKPPEPGDETITVVPEDQPADSHGRPAPEVLFDHHQLLRRLFERVERAPRHGPERRSLMRVLAGELEMHEMIEDEIFYPAVRPVSEEIPLAHSEHRQLADLLAVVVGLDTASPAFDEHLRALHHAVEHHAGAEERSMFPESRRLGDARLRELGRRLEARLEELRESRFQRARRGLKIRLLEGI